MIAIHKSAVVIALAMMLTACATDFVSVWKAPDAQPLQFRGNKVAAIVMMSNEASRRAAEDTLAREITARGAQGVPMYTLFAGGKARNEAEARATLEKNGIAGAIVMRPVRVDKEISSTPASYSNTGYWGGYYGTTVWGGEIRTDTIVVVETLIYSLKQNQLVWGGQSRTTNPTKVDQLVRKLAGDVAKELELQGLITSPPAA